MANMEIANEIYRQIGKQTFFMLGALNISGDERGLTFKIRGSKKVSHINIALNGSDLYDVTFILMGRMEIKNKETVSDVFVGDLHKTIEENTGLVAKLF